MIFTSRGKGTLKKCMLLEIRMIRMLLILLDYLQNTETEGQ